MLASLCDRNCGRLDLLALARSRLRNCARQFVRIETTTTVTLTREDGRTDKTYTLNLSGAGFLLGGPADLTMDEPIKADIDVGEEEPAIHCRGRVVRETGEGYKGVRIEMIEEGDRERLIHFVFERQRTQPRVKT